MAGPLDTAVAGAAGQLRELAARITMLERNQRSGYNARNTTIEGGSLTINGPDGTPAVVIGAQSDGTFTAKQVATVVPPQAPSTPLVSPGINGLYVAWDGLMSSGATPPYDFAATQVHVSSSQNFIPSAATLQGHMVGAGLFGIGGLTPGTTYYVALVAVNGVGDTGPGSTQSSGVPVAVPAGTIAPGSITALQIQTGTITAAQIAAAAGILGSQISTGTITSANILAGTITAALLAAGIVVAGIVDATVITGSTLRNSATDPKTSINPDGSISITNNGGIAVFKIGPDGTIFWFSPGGTLLMELQPGGTQLIYASLTGPIGWNFEPPSAPALLFSTSSAVSQATYSTAPLTSTNTGDTITVIASAAGTGTTATSVTDTQGNNYVLARSVTTNQAMQLFTCTNAFPLTTSDTISITFSAANTTEKNMIALTSSGVLTASVTDFSATASGSSTSAPVSGTPVNYGDLVLYCVSSANAGGAPSFTADGWQSLTSQNVAGQQYTNVWYGTSISGAAISPAATIVSAPWSAILIGLSAKPAAPASTSSPSGQNATLSSSSAWAADGQFSLKITHSNTTSGWGMTTPAFSVQQGALVSMQAQVFTPTALSAVSIGFTFWSGLNGTGTNLGTVSGDQGTLATSAGAVNLVSITGATVPAGANSATFNVKQNAADASGTIYYVDAISVPGGLIYSNSPFPGTDNFGNPFDQGINFLGLPGLTNLFGVEDTSGNQLVAIDAAGNITGQVISAVQDIRIGGSSILDITTPAPLGLVNYGFRTIGGTAWPATAITTEIALFELDQVCQPGRVYEFAMNQTMINATGAGSMHLHLRYTTDGTTPSTSSTEAMATTSRVETAATDAPIGPLRCLFGPFGSTTTLRCLVTGHAGTASWQFKNDDAVRCMIYDLGTGVPSGTNNLTVLGTGTGGGNSPQTYTEYFYPSSTWSYYGPTPSLRNQNSSMYHGAYSGESGYQYSYIQWNAGTLGNNLNTVLNYTVSKVSLRLTNLHSWYNNGMTFGFHTSTSLGSSTYSVILGSFFISEGNTYDFVLGTTMWNPFKAGGTTYAVLAPDAGNQHNLGWYGYFYGKGSNSSQPRLTVVYTH